MSASHEDVLDAIAQSPLADHDALEVVEEWLEMQPADSGHMVISTSADLRRIALYSAGPPEEFVPVVGSFLANSGATEEALAELASAGEGVAAANVGSWLELTHDSWGGGGGIDAGWYFPVNMPLEKARNFAPANPVTQALGEWARRCATHECAQLRRSVDPDSPSAELTIVIPGDDPSHELALIQEGFKSVGAPWFRAEVDAAIRGAGSLDLLFVVAIGQAGLSSAGLLVPQPSLDVVDALAGHAGGDLDAADDFEATLNVDGPGMIGCYQLPWGLGIERFYPLG